MTAEQVADEKENGEGRDGQKDPALSVLGEKRKGGAAVGAEGQVEDILPERDGGDGLQIQDSEPFGELIQQDGTGGNGKRKDAVPKEPGRAFHEEPPSERNRRQKELNQEKGKVGKEKGEVHGGVLQQIHPDKKDAHGHNERFGYGGEESADSAVRRYEPGEDGANEHGKHQKVNKNPNRNC